MRPAWWRDAPGVTAESGWACGWSTTAGPDFASAPDSPAHARAVADLASAAGVAAAAWDRQVHGGTALRADGPGCLGDADALWTARPGLAVVGRGADCPLVLVMGPDAAGAGRWGFAHASWRSTVAGITGGLLAEMAADGMRPDRTRAVIAPSAGPCCYEVGPEVAAAARDHFGAAASDWFPLLGDGRAFDLWRAAARELETGGVPAAAIRPSGICTICGTGPYPSHRREQGRAGRFAALSGGRV